MLNDSGHQEGQGEIKSKAGLEIAAGVGQRAGWGWGIPEEVLEVQPW